MKAFKKFIVPLLLTATVLLSGCSQVDNLSSKQQSKFIDQVMTSFKEKGFESTVIQYFGATKQELTDKLNLSPTDLELYDTVLKEMNYKIEKVVIDGNTSKVTVDVTTVDTKKAMAETFKNIDEYSEDLKNLSSSEDDFRKILIKQLKEKSPSYIDQKIELTFIKENNSWVLQWFDDENFLKLLGGISEK